MSYSQKLAPTTINNPCPVCGDTTGRDRHATEDEAWFCAEHSSIKKFGVVGEFKCISHSKCGFWAIFKLDNSREWVEERRHNQKARQTKRQQRHSKQAFEIELKERQRALSVDERHKLYSEILRGLKLEPATITDLRRRGFTDFEIANCGFKSVRRNQKLAKRYDKQLPGIGNDGKSLVVRGDGYLCPLKDLSGRITGLQVRLHNPTDSNRYRWLSTPQTATLKLQPENENPLAVFHPSGDKPFAIAIVEGTGAKPYFVSQRLNCLTIGAAGGQWLSSPKLLEKYIKQAFEKYGQLPIVVIPDAGWALNQQVKQKLVDTFDWLETNFNNSEIKVLDWNQIHKSRGDIDELEVEDLLKVRWLSLDNFQSTHKEVFSKENSAKPDIDNQSSDNDWAWEKWLKSRKFTPDKTVHQEEFNINNIPASGVIVGAKSGLGTGKTKFLIYLLKQNRKRGKGSVIIGYRNNLLIQTGERALKQKVPIYHIHQDEEARLLMPDESSNHMMCLDSIHHMDGYFKNKDIFLDETVSVLLHAVNGGTLGDGQAKALRIFKKALQDCDRIFLLDGNLADFYVKFIEKIAGNKRVIKVENTKKIPPHNITFIDGIDDEGEIKKRDRSPLIQFLLKPDVKPWIFCDSKERTKVLYKLLTDNGRKGYVLNSETTGENWAKEFLADPNKFIEKYKPDFMILSPSGDSGLSCELKQYFTHKFSFFSGVLGTNSQHQGMFRLRDNGIHHYVFCPEFSTVRNRSNPKNYSANQIKNILNNRIVQSALLATECSDNPQKAMEVIADALNRNDPDWYGFSLQMAALDNYEMDNLRKCLIHILKEAGHNIEIAEWDIVGKVKEAEKKARDEIQLVHSKEIFEAVEFKSIEEANKKAKASPNKATQRRIEKTWLLERLPGIQNTNVWSTQFIHQCHTTRRDFIKQQERYWLLKNYETSQKRHESNWNYAALGEDFFSRSVSAMGHDVIWALRELNLLSFTETNIVVTKKSPEVIQLVKTLRERRDLQLALRISRLEPETVDGKERLRILNKLLEMIGFKTRCAGRKITKTEEGTIRLRHYHVTPIEVHNVVQNRTASTPPHIYIDSQGCGRSQIPYTDKLTSQIDPNLLMSAIREGNVTAPTPPVPKIVASTPPHIYIDSQGCGRSQTPSNNRGYSRFDLKAARKAILEAIEYKHTKWMNSDKSKVKWEVEAEEKPIAQYPIPHSSADIAAEKLRTVNDWGEVDLSQQQINEAWELLSEPEQTRLRNLHADYQQRIHQMENYQSKYSQLENAIASQVAVKEVGFGSHFRSYQILKILDDGIAWVKRLFGDKGEFEIPISQLVF